MTNVEAVMSAACGVLHYLPLKMFEYPFLQRAAVALFLLAPLCSTVGIQVVNFRLAFFADAIGHSAFTGMGLGLLVALLVPALTGWASSFMIGFGVLVALAITAHRRHSGLPNDTIIGIFSSTAVALGLWLFSQKFLTGGEKAFLDFLRGSVLTVTPTEVAWLLAFAVLALTFLAVTYNRLLLVGLNPELALTMGVPVARYEYGFSGLLALLVLLYIPIVGALVVTAMLVIPAAAARNFARTAGAVFWWGLLISWTSSFGGLVLADQFDWAVGATIVLCNSLWFLVSQTYYLLARR